MFGRMPVGGPKPKGGGGKPVAAGPKGVRIEHRIGVQAPGETIWALVHDVAGWGGWNPVYPEARGEVHIGDVLELSLALPGMKPQPVRATVMDWVPNEQLHFRVSSLGGLVRETHYVEIEQLAEESSIVACGVIIGGLLGTSVARQVGSRFYKGLRQMNEALKDRAETRWAAVSPG